MRIVPLLLMLALIGALSTASASAHAKPAYWIGRVTHVSTENIKVADAGGHELSFILVPKFKNIWSENGKTTYQMAYLKPGTHVKVVYDQSVLGARHADKIIVLSR